jgi:hypothetical protein
VSELRGPRAPFPADPLSAEPTYCTRYIERIKTGIRDIIQCCPEAGPSHLKQPRLPGNAGRLPTFTSMIPGLGIKTNDEREKTAAFFLTWRTRV